jgi:hypothetical protein
VLEQNHLALASHDEYNGLLAYFLLADRAGQGKMAVANANANATGDLTCPSVERAEHL